MPDQTATCASPSKTPQWICKSESDLRSLRAHLTSRRWAFICRTRTRYYDFLWRGTRITAVKSPPLATPSVSSCPRTFLPAEHQEGRHPLRHRNPGRRAAHPLRREIRACHGSCESDHARESRCPEKAGGVACPTYSGSINTRLSPYTPNNSPHMAASHCRVTFPHLHRVYTNHLGSFTTDSPAHRKLWINL